MAKAKKKADTTAATLAKKRMAQERHAKGIFPKVYMWLTMTEDAYRATEAMDRAEFCDFVSEAVLREAKAKGMA